MPRAGQRAGEEDGGPGDRISVGVLASAFPREMVDEVIEAVGAREQRRRAMPAWLTLYFTLALALFMDRGSARVMRALAAALAWPGDGATVTVPSEEALSNARVRLGSEPVRLLFERVAGFTAPVGTPASWWRGLRLVSLDGTVLYCQDSRANWDRFGPASGAAATGERYTRVRLVALAECGTGALAGALHGLYDAGEQALAAGLVDRMGPDMLVLADENFTCWELWRDAREAGAHLLWRTDASWTHPVEERLPDGSYISRLKAPQEPRGDDCGDIAVRVLEGMRSGYSGATEAFTLVTSLMDPQVAPAGELEAIYRRRWGLAAALGSLNIGTGRTGVVLRSKTPNGVIQEIWALLCAYHAICGVIAATARLSLNSPRRFLLNGSSLWGMDLPLKLRVRGQTSRLDPDIAA